MIAPKTLSLAAIIITAAYVSSAHAEIVIAVAGPMTGQYVWTGDEQLQGAEMAVADINAKGGVLGQEVRLIIGDDACDPEQAVALANKLVNDGVVFVSGHNCSGSSIPASAVYEKAGILMISPASTSAASRLPAFTSTVWATELLGRPATELWLRAPGTWVGMSWINVPPAATLST